MTYNCNVCNITLRDKYNYNRHIKTLKHIRHSKSDEINPNQMKSDEIRRNIVPNQMKSDEIRRTLDPNLIKQYNKEEQSILIKLKKGIKSENYNCDFCNTTIKNKTNLRKHLQISCIHITDKLRNLLILQHNSRKNTKHKLELLVEPNTSNTKHKIVLNNSNNTSVTNITNSNNTTNNTQNNVTINISGMTEMNYLANESIDHLTEEDKLDILKTPSRLIELMSRKIYKNKANQNVYLYDDRKKLYKYLDYKTKEIIIGSKDNVIQNVCSQNMFHIDSIFDEYQDKISDLIKKKINKLLTEYNNDDINFMKKLEEEIIIRIIEISETSKKRLSNLKRVLHEGNVKYFYDTTSDNENDIIYIAQ
jgi:hypothetical protein